MEQLVLQGARAGGDDDALARQQRGHQVGEGLAGAGAGLHHQPAVLLQGLRHMAGHLQLRCPRPEARQRAGQRPVLPKNVVRSLARCGHGPDCGCRRQPRNASRLYRISHCTIMSRCTRTALCRRLLARQHPAASSGYTLVPRNSVGRNVDMATAPHTFKSLPEISPEVADWVASVASTTHAGPHPLVRWQRRRDCPPARGADRAPGTAAAQREDLPGLLPGPLASQRRGARRAPDLHLHRKTRKTPARTTTGWRRPKRTRTMDALFDGCMKGRTLYVVPYCMGPIDSPYSRCGVEITDSAYVVLNMGIMTRMGRPALERIAADGGKFVRGLHSIGELDPDRRFIMHFPEELSIKSFGSGYGGNALLGKKCHALRIASYQARTEGWLAEHMLIVGLQEPAGRTALHRLRLPVGLRQDQPGHADSAGLACRAGKSSPSATTSAGCSRARMAACGPSIRSPATSASRRAPAPKTNRNAYDMIRRDTLFTNVALTADNEPWWEGIGSRRAGHRLAGSSLRSEERSRRASEFTLHGQRRAEPGVHEGSRESARRADLGAWCSAAAAANSRRWSTRPAAGSTACWSARRWLPRPPPPPPAQSASCVATPWR